MTVLLNVGGLYIFYCFIGKLGNPEFILSLQNSMKNVTEFHLLLYLDFDEATFCKITSLLENDIKTFCIFRYQQNFKCVLDFIERKKSSLKKINFPLCYINDHDLESISVIKGLDLTSINLTFCLELTDFGLSKLCKSQNNIMELNISSCLLSDDAVVLIVKYLPKIKSLFMRNCSRISGVSPFPCNISFHYNCLYFIHLLL